VLSTTLFINTQAECAPDNHSRRRSFWVLCAYRLSRSFTAFLLFFLEFDQNTKRLFWEQLPEEAIQLGPKSTTYTQATRFPCSAAQTQHPTRP
jgi:hypothetical protein